MLSLSLSLVVVALLYAVLAAIFGKVQIWKSLQTCEHILYKVAGTSRMPLYDDANEGIREHVWRP